MENVPRSATNSRLVEYIMESLYTTMPGKVHSYDSSNQVADIIPQTLRGGRALSTIPSVPVVWPRAGGAYIHLPLEAGDFGLIVCCKDDIGAWRVRGDAGNPGDLGMHGLQNAVFIPGLVPKNNTIATVDNVAVISADELRLGDSGADEQVICGNQFGTDLFTYLSALDVWVQAVDTAVGDPTLTTATTVFRAAITSFSTAIQLSPSVKVESP